MIEMLVPARPVPLRGMSTRPTKTPGYFCPDIFRPQNRPLKASPTLIRLVGKGGINYDAN